MKRRALSMLVAIFMVLSTVTMVIPAAAKENLPSISNSKPIFTYTYNSSGKVYRYKEASLKTKESGHWIDCAKDQCKIIEIQNNALKVKYPTSKGEKTGWFRRSDFCKGDLKADQAQYSFRATKKITTYKWKENNTPYGSISKGDKVYLLRGNQNSEWLQVLYPVSGGYKMAWVKGNDLFASSIKLNKSFISRQGLGWTETLTASLSPSDSADAVKWKSNNTSVAKVSGSGVVTAVGYGKTTVIATTKRGKTASATVEVVQPPIPKHAIDLNRLLDGHEYWELAECGTADIYINGQLDANDVSDYWKEWPEGTRYEVRDIKTNSGYQFDGACYGRMSGTVGSSDVDLRLMFTTVQSSTIVPSVVSVYDPIAEHPLTDANVLIQMKTKISMYILAENNSKIKEEHPDWTLLSRAERELFDVNQDGVIDTGDTIVLKQGILALKNSTVRQENPEWLPVSVVYSDYFTGVYQQKTKIKTLPIVRKEGYTFEGWFTLPSGGVRINTGYNVGTKDFYLYPHFTKVREGATPSSVKLNTGNFNLYTGQSKILSATISPSNAANKSLTWSTNNSRVATVNSNGKVTAKGAGTATITARTVNGKTASVKVTVKQPYLTMSESKVTMSVGENKTLTAYTHPSKSMTINWKSSDNSIATVSKGKVVAKKPGTVTITATANGYKQTTAKVTVKKGAKITVFSQADSRWGSHHYGYATVANKRKGIHATIKSGGCGVLSIVNAVYYMDREFINPKTIADFSVHNNYRPIGGTSEGLVKGFCNKKGSVYGIKYIKSAEKPSDIKSNLLNGQVAVIHVKGHFMAMVAYDKSSDKYLVLDSYKSSGRGTSGTGYRWMKENEFTGKMALQGSSPIRVIGKR